NTATESPGAGETDTNQNNDSATDTDDLTPRVDLSITKTDGQTSAVPGTPVTYTITVSNGGPSDVLGAHVDDSLPVTLHDATWTCSHSALSSCTASGTGDIHDVVTIRSGGTLTYTLTATIDAAARGTLTNTASESPSAGETDTS